MKSISSTFVEMCILRTDFQERKFWIETPKETNIIMDRKKKSQQQKHTIAVCSSPAPSSWARDFLQHCFFFFCQTRFFVTCHGIADLKVKTLLPWPLNYSEAWDGISLTYFKGSLDSTEVQGIKIAEVRCNSSPEISNI